MDPPGDRNGFPGAVENPENDVHAIGDSPAEMLDPGLLVDQADDLVFEHEVSHQLLDRSVAALAVGLDLPGLQQAQIASGE